MWIGPFAVTRADVHSFRIKHLITGEERYAHPSRLKFYSDESLDVSEEILDHITAQGIVLAVDELKSCRWNAKISDYEVLVDWKGLQSIDDSWEPLKDLTKQIKVLVSKCISTQSQDVQKYWQSHFPDGLATQDAAAVNTASCAQPAQPPSVRTPAKKAAEPRASTQVKSTMPQAPPRRSRRKRKVVQRLRVGPA